MSTIYTDGRYLSSNDGWHMEDSPWKAEHVCRLLQRNGVDCSTVAEIGCGAGQILKELSLKLPDRVTYSGFDISPQAIELAMAKPTPRVDFRCENLLERDAAFDVLLVMDVIEHVPDYLGFAEKCRTKAKYKVYHIPLEISVSALVRNSIAKHRYDLGHIHYFTADSALAALRDTGHTIVDWNYTAGAVDLFWRHPSLMRGIANVPRWLVSRVSSGAAARMFGGFSVLVLTQ